MARWIGAIGGLLLVGVAAAQLAELPNLAGHPNEVTPAANQQVLPPPPFLDVGTISAPLTVQYTPPDLNNANTQVFVTDPAGNPVSPPGANATPVYLNPQVPGAATVASYPVYQDAASPPVPPVPYAENVYTTTPPFDGQSTVIPRTTIDVVEPPIEPLEIMVYSVADLVVGQGTASDPNQALLLMLAQQSEELAMALNAASAAGGATPQHTALNELAETIRSTFAAEFKDERASITLHRNTMSLIVRQSETVHGQIRDLLDQLRHANNTSINVSIELVELDEARTPFAMSHNGQVLDDAAAAEFRALAEEGEAEQLKFNVTVGNGQSMSMLASGLPGTMTAVASHDHREVRLLLDMMLGMEMGVSQTFNHRIPAGESLLTIFSCEGTGYVVLLSAEINQQEELEEALYGDDVAPATHVENAPPAPPSEPVSQARRPLIMTQTMLVEVDALPENFLEQLLERFDGEILPDSEPHAAVLRSATGNDVVLALQEDHADLRIISKPQTSWGSSGGEGSLHIGRDVPVIYGIAFEDDVIVPLARHQDIGIWLNSVFTVTDDGSIESRVHVTRKKVLDEEVVVYSSPDPTITSPVIGSATASTTFTVPQGKTVVWPVPPIGGTESDGSTLLILLTSQVRGDADPAD